MVNTLSKGQVRAGKFIGLIQGTSGSIGTTEIANEAVTVGKMADLARGSIFSGQTGNNRPAALDAKASAQLLLGDGTDILSVAMTGAVAITAGGVTTLPQGFEDEGHGAIGYVYCTGIVADTELVTINSRTYEFLNGSGLTGNVAVDITGGDQSADYSCIQLAAAINGDGSRDVDAVVMAGNSDTTAGVLLIAKVVGASNFSLSTDITNGGIVSAGTMTGAAVAASKEVTFEEYTITAADATLLALTGGNSIVIAGVISTAAPTLHSLVVTTSAGAIVPTVATLAFIWVQVNTNYYALVLDDGAATLTNGDKIGMVISV